MFKNHYFYMAFWMMMSLHDEVQGNQSKLKEAKAKPKQNQRTTKGKPKKSKGKPK